MALNMDAKNEDDENCELCCVSLPKSDFHVIESCGCKFCKNCLKSYVTVAIKENLVTPNLNCPDAKCPKASNSIKKHSTFSLHRVISHPKISSSTSVSYLDVHNIISSEEIEMLTDETMFGLYKKLKIEFEVDQDPDRVWCPEPNCDTVCVLSKPSSTTLIHSSQSNFSFSSATPTSVITSLSLAPDSKAFPFYCPKCDKTFCSSCRHSWHMSFPCPRKSADESLLAMLNKEGTANADEPFEIKRCPRCSVWIERDEGCAQMMCRKCKHVFCWFCLQSLEDDFLLRHYDKGPCKNKLGHSRASVIWHRTQVVGVFAGFGVLLLLASPLFLLAAPFCLCCNCCSSSCKILEDDVEFDEEDGLDGESTPINGTRSHLSSHASLHSGSSSVFKATSSTTSRKTSFFRFGRKSKKNKEPKSAV
ncbi:E3 ubiquitin-protein ligase [Halotydeus destructor]|nr:E3 ubiquitin-protein ligase [Halotydeus destructor]